jgi:hypothetical protein
LRSALRAALFLIARLLPRLSLKNSASALASRREIVERFAPGQFGPSKPRREAKMGTGVTVTPSRALRPRVGLAVVVLAQAASASAQPFAKPPADRPSFSAPAAPCGDLAVEPQLVLRRDDSSQGESLVEFTITVSVTNPCAEPLAVRYGSFLSYQTNFPPVVESGGQPAGCAGRQWSFSGTVPPHQRSPFMLRVQRCVFPSARGEPPRVALESGTLVTDRGERPIPSLTRFLP